jgi:acyl-CoA dehydrogenase
MMQEALANTPERQAVRDAVRAICDRYDDDYWGELDRTHTFPHEFCRDIAAGGWLGIAMPAEYGGSGLGVTEASIMMQVVGASAGYFAACSAIHINIFGLHSIVKHGSDAQKREWLPKVISGEIRACFGVTEPDAGLDTTRIKTRAVRRGDHYVVHGQKIWTSTAQQAHKIVLLARTTPLEECARPTEGLTLFFADKDPRTVKVTEIPKMGRHAVNSNQVFYDGLEIPVEHRIGEEGQGFRYILDSLNPERIRGAGHGAARARQGGALRGRTRGLRPPYRQEPGHRPPAGRSLGRALRRGADDAPRLRAVRQRQALRRRGQRRQAAGRRRRLQGLRPRHPHPWRHGLRR